MSLNLSAAFETISHDILLIRLDMEFGARDNGAGMANIVLVEWSAVREDRASPIWICVM